MSLIEKKLGIKISETICISLKDQQKRQDQTLEECQKINLPIKFFLADRHPINGVIGCLESHIHCIKYAKEHNLENIFIIEDDIQFDIDALNNIENIDVPKDFDMLYLGYHVNRGYRYSKNLIKLTSALTTHGYILNKKMYDVILDNVNTNWSIIPEYSDLNNYEKPFFANNLKAIDMFYAKWIHHKGDNSYGIYPMVAYQRPEYSAIENRHVDYKNLFITKANIFYNHRKGKFIGEYTYGSGEYKTKQDLLNYLSTLKQYEDYDYVFIKHHELDTTNLKHIDYSIYNSLKSDILCITNTLTEKCAYYMRFNYFIKDKEDTKIEYFFPPLIDSTDLIEYHEHIMSNKPILCFFYKQFESLDWLKKKTGITNSFLNKFNVYICTENFHNKNYENITIISPDKYEFLPKHYLILINDITFFIDQPVHCHKIILFMTHDKFVDNWKNLSVPFEGYSLFHNMIDHISQIICYDKEIFNNFLLNYDLLRHPKSTFILKNQLIHKHGNNFICNDDTLSLELYKKIKEKIPNSTYKLYKDNNDFINSEIFICFNEEDRKISESLKSGTICIGNNDNCNLNIENNNIDAIISFISNPIKKNELIDNIYRKYNPKDYFTTFTQLFNYI